VTFGSNITTATTVNAVGAVTVVQVNGDISLNNLNFTLNGNSSQDFIVRVTGSLSLVGTAALALSGGVTPSHVIYDFTGTSSKSINTHVGDVINGIVITQNLPMTLDGTFNGELIGGKSISLLSGAIVNQPPSTVPEPKDITMLGAMLLGIAFLARKRNPVRP
jgi:hypothetical protein